MAGRCAGDRGALGISLSQMGSGECVFGAPLVRGAARPLLRCCWRGVVVEACPVYTRAVAADVCGRDDAEEKLGSGRGGGG